MSAKSATRSLVRTLLCLLSWGSFADHFSLGFCHKLFLPLQLLQLKRRQRTNHGSLRGFAGQIFAIASRSTFQLKHIIRYLTACCFN
uniref:Putative secreted protein n=1 Tax=Anopheles triannulatus TaxID=58253 RepID=A0A2M4B5W0_9DIPT